MKEGLMDNIANQSKEERALLFEATAQRKHLTTAVIEKDFWVCWMLDILFRNSDFANCLTFKGGTSLSKAYGLIDRFSEDIDLVLDWRVLGYDTHAPFAQMSGKQEKRLLKEMVERRNEHLSTYMVPALVEILGARLTEHHSLIIDPVDPAVVLFDYPKTTLDPSIDQRIRLEIGHRSAIIPRELKEIASYCAEEFPGTFEYTAVSVNTVDARRTFFEKLLILYKESNRVEGGIPPRYSRHYYDVFRIASSSFCESALSEPQLFADVLKFTKLFFPTAWAKYDEAELPRLRLMPPSHSLKTLADDYQHMRSMFFTTPPTLDEIMDGIRSLEQRLTLSVQYPGL